MEQNILKYLSYADIDLGDVMVIKTADKQYQISVNDTDENAVNEKMQAIIAQVDRDTDHPVVMDGNEVLTMVIQQPQLSSENALFIVVEITPVV